MLQVELECLSRSRIFQNDARAPDFLASSQRHDLYLVSILHQVQVSCAGFPFHFEVVSGRLLKLSSAHRSSPRSPQAGLFPGDAGRSQLSTVYWTPGRGYQDHEYLTGLTKRHSAGKHKSRYRHSFV